MGFQMLEQIQLLFGTQHQIDPFDVSYLVRLQLGIATRYDHKGSRVLLADPPDGLSAFLIGQFSDGTGVDNTNIGLFARAYFPYALLGQQFADGGCFCKIQFTSHCKISSFLCIEYCLINHVHCCF